MEWTDTLILETAGRGMIGNDQAVALGMQVSPVQGVSLLHAKVHSREETEVALKLLRGFRAAGRRVVLCDTSYLADDHHTFQRQLGHTLVEVGNAEVLVSCGVCGREVAIGARDEGLELANVVVCGDTHSACEVLTHQLIAGDTVLLLGVDDETRARLILSLEKRLSRPAVAA
jgi:hypothetical protein